MSFDDAFRRAAIAERERDRLADALTAAERDRNALRD